VYVQRACVRACVRACLRACVRICFYKNHKRKRKKASLNTLSITYYVAPGRKVALREKPVSESPPPPFNLMSPVKSSQQVGNIFLMLKRYEPFCLRKLCLALILNNIETDLIISNLDEFKFNDIFNNDLIFSIKNNLNFYEKIEW